MITFDSIHETYMTFQAEKALLAGQVCKITGNGTVGPCAAGDEFCGAARSVRLGMAGVVLSGFVRLPYSGDAPAVGYAALCADGKGGVKTGGERTYLVAQVEDGAVGVFL